LAPSSGFDESPPELEPFADPDALPEPLELLLDADREREPAWDRGPDREPEREPDCDREPDREPGSESDPDDEPWLLPFVAPSG
jgi:hypothetical protein